MRGQGPAASAIDKVSELDPVDVSVILPGRGNGKDKQHSRRRRASLGATARQRRAKSRISCSRASTVAIPNVAVGGAASVEVKGVNELSSEEAGKEDLQQLKNTIPMPIANK